jgi:hypothetical protein
MTWAQGAKENKCSPLICFFVMIASLLVAAHYMECLRFCLMGGLLPFSVTSISMHVMHPKRTLADCICYHPINLYLASAYAPFYEDNSKIIILDHPIDYGLYRNRGPASLGHDGLFVEPY